MLMGLKFITQNQHLGLLSWYNFSGGHFLKIEIRRLGTLFVTIKYGNPVTPRLLITQQFPSEKGGVLWMK